MRWLMVWDSFVPLYFLIFSFKSVYWHTRFHLGFSAKLRIYQVPTCKMEPQIGIIIIRNQPADHPTDHPTTSIFEDLYPSFHWNLVPCPHHSLDNWPNNLHLNVRCPPPLLLIHHRILCGVSTLVWKSCFSSLIGLGLSLPLLKHHKILCGVPTLVWKSD